MIGKRESAERSFRLLEPAGDPVRRDAYLAGVVAKANALASKPAAEEIGPLRPGSLCYDGSPAAWRKLQSEPLRWLDGGAFFLNLGSSEEMLFSPSMIASELDRAHASIPADRMKVIALVDTARRIASEALSARVGGATAPEPAAVGVMPYPYTGGIDVVVELDLFGNDLSVRPTSIKVTSSDTEGALRNKIDRQLDLHEMRAEMLRGFEARRARGWIEATTQSIMAAAGMDIDFVLERLDRLNSLKFAFDAGRQSAEILWRNGVLSANFEKPARNVMLFNNELHFEPMPHSLAMGLRGRPVGEVLHQEHIPADTIIANVRVDTHWTVLTLQIPMEILRTAETAIPF